MPAIYSAQKLHQIWGLLQEGKNVFEIGKILSIHDDDLMSYVAAACKKFGEPKLKYKKSDYFPTRNEKKQTSFERPKAEYSNKGYLQLMNQ